MPLTRVTITGADDAVDPSELRSVFMDFRFVEWGILRAATREGQPRYPTAEWRERLEAQADAEPEMPLSAHFCGRVARETLAGATRWLETDGVPLWVAYDSIQLNGFDGQLTQGFDNSINTVQDVEWILQCPDERVIADAACIARGSTTVSALYDCSGGRGVEPFSWPRAPLGLRLGYAGGINPENVLDVLNAIGPVSHDFWIDMESGVRTDDRFDMSKVRRVLEAVAPFVAESRGDR